jgi:predicted nucleic acid-binding protein
MNSRRAFIVSMCAVVAAALTLPAGAAPLEVITLEARVQSLNGSTNGDFRIGDGIPGGIGERLKVSLVGTGIFNGAGREVPVDARFFVAAGGANCSLARTGPSWAEVSIHAAGGNGLCQIGYTAAANYQMKPGLATGRLTFKIGSAAPAPAPPALSGGAEPGAPNGYERERWHRAWQLDAMLVRAILGEEPHGERARADADRIYREGYGGVLTVAMELARGAEERGLGRSTMDRGYQERDIERLAGLYRDLLHRQQSDRDLWQQDPGFRANVDALHRKGLSAVVSSIVDADEFRSVNQIGPR